MRLYIPGPGGPDLMTTKWQLQLRGYKATCTVDVEKNAYNCTWSRRPFNKRFQHLQIEEMLGVDAVVATEDLDDTNAISLLTICGFIGTQLVPIELLPALATCGMSLHDVDLCTSPERISQWWERRTGKRPLLLEKLADRTTKALPAAETNATLCTGCRDRVTEGELKDHDGLCARCYDPEYDQEHF